MKNNKKLGFSLYQLLSNSVSIFSIAEYFHLEKDVDGHFLLSFDGTWRAIFLEEKFRTYHVIGSRKINGDFADLFRKASKQQFDKEITILAAWKEIAKLLCKGKLKATSERHLSMLKCGLYRP